MFEVSLIGDAPVRATGLAHAWNLAHLLNLNTGRVVQVHNTTNGRHVYIADGQVSVYQKDGQEDYSKGRN